MIITSASNDKIKDIRRLIKSSKDRRQSGLYVVEGIRMCSEIPKNDINELYVSESGYDKYQDYIKKISIEPVVVSDKVFCTMSDTNTPQGIMALVKIKDYKLEDVCKECSKQLPFILIMDKLQDPGNMGTIIRTAEGAGVTGIIISSDSVDVYNPKVIRSTMGSIFRMPIYISSNLVNDINEIKKKGVVIYGAHLDGKDLYEKNMEGACAFLIGNEGNGLSEDVSCTADELIKIPMNGNVESLNAAISTAIISYEVMRQRKYSAKLV